MPLGIDATIRYAETTGRARCGCPSSSATALQHPPEPRPAADADRQPRARVAARRRQAGQQGLPLLRASSRARRASTRSRPPTRSSSATSRATRPRARQLGGKSPVTVDDVPGRVRLAGRALALAGDAQRRARRRRAWTAGATCCCRCRRDLFAETVRALPAAGFRGVNVTIPHKEAALALADEATETARAIGAANTLTFEDGGSSPTTPTRRACSAP